MAKTLQLLKNLHAFKNTPKFSADKWEERGLIPSPQPLPDNLEQKFNAIADLLVSQVANNVTAKSLTPILEKELYTFEHISYDTEEREFIADTFFALAKILGIKDFGKVLESWMYGAILNQPRANSNAPFKTHTQPCDTCGEMLQTNIIHSSTVADSYMWVMGMCNNCKKPNIIAPDAGAKQIIPVNYIMLGTLPVNTYSLEQVTAFLEQLKNMKM